MASEYGWTHKYILEDVYPDDFLYLSELIKRRQGDRYLMQVYIALAPHMENEDREKFVRGLREMSTNRRRTGKLDHAGFERLRNQLKQNSRGIKAY